MSANRAIGPGLRAVLRRGLMRGYVMPADIDALWPSPSRSRGQRFGDLVRQGWLERRSDTRATLTPLAKQRLREARILEREGCGGMTSLAAVRHQMRQVGSMTSDDVAALLGCGRTGAGQLLRRWFGLGFLGREDLDRYTLPTQGVHMGYPHRIVPIVNRIQRSGPLTLNEIGDLLGSDRSHKASTTKAWVQAGWLVQRADGRYEAGPKALSGNFPKPRAMPVDRTEEEGSDQWYVLQQLAHGRRKVLALAELLDMDGTEATKVVDELRELGMVRRAGGGYIELSDPARRIAG